jgi:hypothetical protein
LFFFEPGSSQQPQQFPQHLKHEKQLQQHDLAQQAQRTMHQRMLKRMRPPTIMMAMTGYLLLRQSCPQPPWT